jgi:hypothetical protein
MVEDALVKEDQGFSEKLFFDRLLKNARIQGARNPEE